MGAEVGEAVVEGERDGTAPSAAAWAAGQVLGGHHLSMTGKPGALPLEGPCGDREAGSSPGVVHGVIAEDHHAGTFPPGAVPEPVIVRPR